ncbi:MAG: c-type cytochrome [Acidobacteriota bacterium]
MAINMLEKRALMGAVGFVAVSLGLIAYATWGLGINVPTCVPLGTKPFESASVTKHDGKNFEVHYIARMWAFEPSVLRVPTGSTLDIYAVTKDVTHGLLIAGTNVNLMVVPGAVANTRVHFDKPGVYTIVCHEFCGKGHQDMNARIEVSDQLTDFAVEGIPSDPGLKLLDDKGCLACHSTDGSDKLGPSLKGAWGSTLHLTDGKTLTLDAAAFEKKVNDPTAYTVNGFPPVMPPVPVTADEMKQLEKYMEGLKN